MGATFVGVVVGLVLVRPPPDEVGNPSVIGVRVGIQEIAGVIVRVEIAVNVVTYDTVETCKEVITWKETGGVEHPLPGLELVKPPSAMDVGTAVEGVPGFG